ncbi:hypothetical protein LINGRAHAP2_LOCUS35359 [Linum grandiflorum]
MAANLRISHLLLLLLLTLSTTRNNSRAAEARPLPFSSLHLGSSKIFATLGVVCKCCDNRETEKSECSSSWEGSCRDVQCLPWRIG